MLNRIPWAPAMLTSSSGLAIAIRAASTARFSPVARPIPISAEPASFMIARTSAKSRLIRPGIVMMSLIPWTPWRRTSSTTRKASMIEVFFWTTSLSRSFGIVIRVSTWALSSSAAFSATSLRLAPSNAERLGHDADRQRAGVLRQLGDDRGGAGAGPAAEPGGDEDHVRVGEGLGDLLASPPRPPARRSTLSPPAPRPRVILSPMRILCGASDWRSAWASVLQAMNSTPIISARIIRLTALLPPPPTPMTRMSAKFSESDRNAIVFLRGLAGSWRRPSAGGGRRVDWLREARPGPRSVCVPLGPSGWAESTTGPSAPDIPDSAAAAGAPSVAVPGRSPAASGGALPHRSVPPDRTTPRYGHAPYGHARARRCDPARPYRHWYFRGERAWDFGSEHPGGRVRPARRRRDRHRRHGRHDLRACCRIPRWSSWRALCRTRAARRSPASTSSISEEQPRRTAGSAASRSSTARRRLVRA